MDHARLGCSHSIMDGRHAGPGSLSAVPDYDRLEIEWLTHRGLAYNICIAVGRLCYYVRVASLSGLLWVQ